MRIRGPFDGIRVGLIDQPVSLYDLSEGGCFVNSTVDVAAGSRLVLRVDLSDADWIMIQAETVYSKSGYDFAVRFIEISDETRARLRHRLRQSESESAPYPRASS